MCQSTCCFGQILRILRLLVIKNVKDSMLNTNNKQLIFCFAKNPKSGWLIIIVKQESIVQYFTLNRCLEEKQIYSSFLNNYIIIVKTYSRHKKTQDKRGKYIHLILNALYRNTTTTIKNSIYRVLFSLHFTVYESVNTLFQLKLLIEIYSRQQLDVNACVVEKILIVGLMPRLYRVTNFQKRNVTLVQFDTNRALLIRLEKHVVKQCGDQLKTFFSLNSCRMNHQKRFILKKPTLLLSIIIIIKKKQ